MADNRFETALKNALARWNRLAETEADEEIPAMSAAFLDRMDSMVREERQPKREGYIMTKQNKKNWKKAWTAAICAAAVLTATGCVYAAVPAVREYVNMLFLQKDSSGQLTEVPDGWIGVYTVEDLEAVREDLNANYILMNDIVIPDEYYEPGGIYENGFTPIGGDVHYSVVDENGDERWFTHDMALKGTFNGNGYVISNLHIRDLADDRDVSIGLFSKCNSVLGDPVQNIETEEYYRNYIGGIIKNLGITDSSVEVIIDNPQMYGTANIIVGMIAGECDVIAGCFTENVSVSVTFADTLDPELVFSSVKIGGVAGKTIITDSCWSDAVITLANNSAAELKSPYVAGVVGFANSCVTSYFCGEIQSIEGDYGVAGFDATTPPTLLSDTIMEEIRERFRAVDDEWNLVKLSSFYVYCRADEMQMYITKDISETGGYFYLIDPEMKERERKELSSVLSTIFAGDEFMAFCQENDVKYGAYDNYDLRYEADTGFDGFDFTYIWRMGNDGLPKLRLF
ncbi:MAG: hypothetical protein IKY52_07010 [Clostridia bacterium]|nr:hypothetical protein [Clostridia bacterium]